MNLAIAALQMLVNVERPELFKTTEFSTAQFVELLIIQAGLAFELDDRISI